jgi:hypothetical protein
MAQIAGSSGNQKSLFCTYCQKQTLHESKMMQSGCIFTILTLGLFLPIWICLHLFSTHYRCQTCGRTRSDRKKEYPSPQRVQRAEQAAARTAESTGPPVEVAVTPSTWLWIGGITFILAGIGMLREFPAALASPLLWIAGALLLPPGWEALAAKVPKLKAHVTLIRTAFCVAALAVVGLVNQELDDLRQPNRPAKQPPPTAIAEATARKTASSPSATTTADNGVNSAKGEDGDALDLNCGELISRVMAGEDFAGRELIISGTALNDTESGLVNVGTHATYRSKSFDNFVSVYEVGEHVKAGSHVWFRVKVEESSAARMPDGAIFVLIDTVRIGSSSDTISAPAGTDITTSRSASSVTGEMTFRFKSPGWISRKDCDKVADYISQGDLEAFESFVANGLLTGTCTLFEKGETVYRMDTAIFSGLVKVRRRGETVAYWTQLEAVR